MLFLVQLGHGQHTPCRPPPEAAPYHAAADARSAAIHARDAHGTGSPEERAATRTLDEARERFRDADHPFAEAARREKARRSEETATPAAA